MRASEPGLRLNRPSNPCFWSAVGGPPALLLSTFVAAAEPGDGADTSAGAAQASPERGLQRGIAAFEAPPGCASGGGTQHAVPAARAATVDVDEWSPWGLCRHGTRLFATGHSSVGSSHGHSRADAEEEQQEGADGQHEEAKEAAKVPVGSVRVYEGNAWRVLRGGLREPNYILVC